jgi:hypothetical protein
MAKNKITQIQQMAFISTVRDGTELIIISILLLISGFAFMSIYTQFILPFIILILLKIWKNISWKIKIKYVFPRLGYVKLMEDHEKLINRSQYIFTSIIISSTVIMIYISYLSGISIDSVLRNVPLVVGSSLLARSIFYSIFSGKKYFLILGVFEFILSIIFLTISFESGMNALITFLFITSTILFIVGVFIFIEFIKKNKIVEVDINL